MAKIGSSWASDSWVPGQIWAGRAWQTDSWVETSVWDDERWERAWGVWKRYAWGFRGWGEGGWLVGTWENIISRATGSPTHRPSGGPTYQDDYYGKYFQAYREEKELIEFIMAVVQSGILDE